MVSTYLFTGASGAVVTTHSIIVINLKAIWRYFLQLIDLQGMEGGSQLTDLGVRAIRSNV